MAHWEGRYANAMHTSILGSKTAAQRDEGRSHHMQSGKGCWLVRYASWLRLQALAQKANKRNVSPIFHNQTTPRLHSPLIDENSV